MCFSCHNSDSVDIPQSWNSRLFANIISSAVGCVVNDCTTPDPVNLKRFEIKSN